MARPKRRTIDSDNEETSETVDNEKIPQDKSLSSSRKGQGRASKQIRLSIDEADFEGDGNGRTEVETDDADVPSVQENEECSDAWNDTSRSSSLSTMSCYRGGSILRVKMENFLTYDFVEFFPGPRLNVVVGPNGTGKSTILCALCLGLGGEPPLLGRANDARAFIQHGKDVGAVEVELVSNGKVKSKGHTIRRVIDRNQGSEKGRGRGASTFYINGTKSSKVVVKELVTKQYNIAIDNLCTFLPQDKVGGFSGFTPQQVLKETQKALSGEQMYNVHERLIQLEEELHNSNRTVESVGDKLSSLKAENEQLEREKKRMEERQEAVEKIKLIDKKLLWLNFDTQRLEALKLKEEKKKAREELKKVSGLLEPLRKKASELKSKYERGKHRSQNLDKKIRENKREHEVHIRKAERFSDDIENSQVEIKNIDAAQKRAEANVQRLEHRCQEAEENLKKFPPKQDLQKEMDEAKSKLRAMKPLIDAAKRERDDIYEKGRDLQDRAVTSRRNLDRMNDEKARRRDKVFMQQRNLKKTYEWVDQNRKMFRRPVWGPVVLEVTMKDVKSSSFLEHHVPNATLKSYIVECREDYNLLYREVREKLNIPINISIVPNGVLEPTRRIYSEEKMRSLKQNHGVVGYLDETFVAPDAVTQAIINAANVGCVLVGTSDTQKSIDKKNLLMHLSKKENGAPMGYCIFSSDGRDRAYRYTGSVSRYSGKVNISIDEINAAKNLAPGAPQKQKDDATNLLKEINEEIDELEPKIAENYKRYSEHQSEGKALQTSFNNASQRMKSFNDQNRKVATARQKLADEKINASKDYAVELTHHKSQLKKNIKNTTINLDLALKKHDELMNATFDLAAIKLADEVLRTEAQKAQDYYDEKRVQISQHEGRVQELDRAFTAVRNNVKALKQVADREAPMVEPLKSQLEDLPDTQDEIDAMKEEYVAKVNGISDNPGVIRDYERRKKEIQDEQENLAQLAEEQDLKKRELIDTMKPWETRLINTVNKVDALFSNYMKELGFCGNVKLFTGMQESSNDNENAPLNFKDWGIQLLVQFRTVGEVSILSAQVHSGGERSVSTIMYLMALQDMMISPFRCVDEINQGLDERNERLVFRRIVHNSTRLPMEGKSANDHSGQYFLITPKLLPNLTDMENENVTILFIFNGPFNFNQHLDWQVDDFVLKKRRLTSSSTASFSQSQSLSQS